jgi:subtilisin family serine protease
MRRTVSVALVATLIAGLSAIAATPSSASNDASAKRHTATGRIIVGYVDGASSEARGQARGHAKAELVKQVKSDGDGEGTVEVVKAANGANADDVMADLASDPDVAYAEPDEWLTLDAATTDPELGNLWGMGGTYGSQAPSAWSLGNTGSSNVYVGIVDTGADYSHPDLVNNFWTNPGEIANDGKDNDGDGYVDDVHGYDFFHGDGSTYDPADGDNHGTHVAGTIGAEGNNGIGVVGMNWDVTMISAKFLGPNGGYTSDAVSAIDYLTKLKQTKGLNIVAINNSWGGGGYSTSLANAIIRAAKQNILFVAAAGNNGSNNDSVANYPSNYNTALSTTQYPGGAGYDSVIAVAALTSSGGLASYSDWGATTVDLGAPGSGIESTLPNNTYGYYSGTSMATPHVTGAVALYANGHPGASAASIKSAILSTTTATTSLTNKTVTGGRLNVSTFGPAASPPPPTTGTLSGVVTDTSTHAWIAGATVSLNAGATTTTTDAVGAYSFTVAAGTYTVTASKSGYSSATMSGLSVTAGNTTNQDLALTPVPSQPMTANTSTVQWTKSGKWWTGRVTITVRSGGSNLPGAAVTGTWSYGTSTSCTTDANGECTVTSSKQRNTSATWTLTGVAKDGYYLS